MKQFLKLKETSQYKKAVGAESYSREKMDATQEIRLKVLSTSVSDMEQIIKDNGLEEVYNSLDRAKLPQPVSFDFKLKKLRIQNLRSIEDLTIDFSEGNSVTALTGHTGSGKSTVLLAIILALRGDPHLARYNRRLPSGEVLNLRVELELDYNSKTYYITRSSDGERRLAIGNTEHTIPSASLKAFNEYLFNELPFITSLDFFIVSPNTHYFDKVDRVELFKTVFNLDIFNSLFVQAKSKYSDYTKKLDAIEKDRIAEDSRNKALNGQKSSILTSLDSDLSFLDNLTIFEENLTKLKNFNEQIRTLSGQIEVNKAKYKLNNDRLGGLKQYSIDDIKKKIYCWQVIESFGNTMQKYERDLKIEEDSVLRLKSTLNNLTDTSLYCPNCNTLVKGDEKYREYKVTYENELHDHENRAEGLREAIKNSITGGIQFAESEPSLAMFDNNTHRILSKMDKQQYEYKSILSSLESVASIVNETDTLTKNIQAQESQLAELTREMNELLQGRDYETCCLEFADKIKKGTVVKEYKKLLVKLDADIEASNTTLANLIEDSSMLSNESAKIKKFMDMFDFNNLNSIPYLLIDKILKTINTNDIEFTAKKTLKSGDERFKINCAVKIKGLFVDYDDASDGQKTLMDLFILNRIISLLNGVGVLVMDECLSNIDDQLYSRVKEFFDNTPCNDILVVSHNPNFEGATRTIRCSLNDEGITNVEVGK